MLKLKLSPRHGDAQNTLTTLFQLVNAQAERQRLGNVHFETSCTAEAQKALVGACCISTRSSTLLEEAFALKADPTCAIAY
jgi:hypothetical protein